MLAADDVLALPGAMRRRRELLPLVHALLEAEGRLGAIGGEERALARRAYYVSLARSVAVREQLLALLDDARAEGARPLVVKGALLAHAVYPDPAMRPMADLDVALRPGDVERLSGRLVARGYRVEGVGRRRFRLDFTHHVVLAKEGRIPVELHARLCHELGADGAIEPLFARAIAAPAPGLAPGATLPAPSWEEHLAYLALHAATHAFADSPIWIADLAAVAPRVADGALVFAAAQRMHAWPAVAVAFALARRHAPRTALPLGIHSPSLRWRARAVDLALGAGALDRPPSAARSLLARAALHRSMATLVTALAAKARVQLAERLLE